MPCQSAAEEPERTEPEPESCRAATESCPPAFTQRSPPLESIEHRSGNADIVAPEVQWKLYLELVGNRSHPLDPSRDPLGLALVGDAVHEAAERNDTAAHTDDDVVVQEARLPVQLRHDVSLDVSVEEPHQVSGANGDTDDGTASTQGHRESRRAPLKRP
jgi:hypothetical protein